MMFWRLYVGDVSFGHTLQAASARAANREDADAAGYHRAARIHSRYPAFVTAQNRKEPYMLGSFPDVFIQFVRR